MYYIFDRRKDVREDNDWNFVGAKHTFAEVEKHINDGEYYGDLYGYEFFIIDGNEVKVEHIRKNVLEQRKKQ